MYKLLIKKGTKIHLTAALNRDELVKKKNSSTTKGWTLFVTEQDMKFDESEIIEKEQCIIKSCDKYFEFYLQQNPRGWLRFCVRQDDVLFAKE